MDTIHYHIEAICTTKALLGRAEERYQIALARATGTSAKAANPLGVRVQTSVRQDDPCLDLIEAKEALAEARRAHYAALTAAEQCIASAYHSGIITETQFNALIAYYCRYTMTMSKARLAAAYPMLWQNGRQVRTAIDGGIRAIDTYQKTHEMKGVAV